jgi:hypothetical protein
MKREVLQIPGTPIQSQHSTRGVHQNSEADSKVLKEVSEW